MVVLTTHVLTWDWREQPDFTELDVIVGMLSGGTVHMALADTESDSYALVVADAPLTEDEVQEAWWRHRYACEADGGEYEVACAVAERALRLRGIDADLTIPAGGADLTATDVRALARLAKHLTIRTRP